MKKRFLLILSFLLFTNPSFSKDVAPSNKSNNSCLEQFIGSKQIVGSIEWIELPDHQIKLKARVDTGAKTSSLHAWNIREFKKGNKHYIEFDTTNKDGNKVHITKEILYQRNVKNSYDSQKRYFVDMKIKIGNVEEVIEVNLSNRSKMKQKFLIGRNLLNDKFIVDVSKNNLMDSEN